MKQSHILSVFFLFLMTSSAFAQLNVAPSKFKNGLYKTFGDLIDGNVVTKIPYREGVKSNKEAVTRYELMHEGEYKPIKGIYCYVNDNHIYLNARAYNRKGYYIRSHFTGRYTYFEDRLGKEKFSMSAGAPGMTAPTGAAVTSKIWGILLDMKTGEVIKTSRWKMKKILESYPRLWKKYKRSQKTNREVYDIIVELNEVSVKG